MARFKKRHSKRVKSSKMFGTGNMQFAAAKRKKNYHNSRGGGQM